MLTDFLLGKYRASTSNHSQKAMHEFVSALWQHRRAMLAGEDRLETKAFSYFRSQIASWPLCFRDELTLLGPHNFPMLSCCKPLFLKNGLSVSPLPLKNDR
jgi:hypothetical protein